MTTLLTVGHGTLAADAFSSLVRGAGVERVVDVRSFPGSRRHPHFGRDRLERWLSEAGIAYRHEPRLGGRRTVSPTSAHVALRNEGFRGYADHMGGEEFVAALDELLASADDRVSAVMCAESVWWRCHRRLLADAAVLVRSATVEHLMHDGRRQPHVPTDGVRRDGDHLTYDGGQSPLVAQR